MKVMETKVEIKSTVEKFEPIVVSIELRIDSLAELLEILEDKQILENGNGVVYCENGEVLGEVIQSVVKNITSTMSAALE